MRNTRTVPFLSVSMVASSVGFPYFLGFRQQRVKHPRLKLAGSELRVGGNAPAVLSIEPERGKPLEQGFSTRGSRPISQGWIQISRISDIDTTIHNGSRMAVAKSQ